MKMKKNKFFTLIFSMMFGAGQMYMGFMKMGISLMSLATAIFFFGFWFQSGVIMLALPVLWFYSFFDSINIMSMPEEKFQDFEDHYFFLQNTDNKQIKKLLAKYNAVIAVILILVGVSVLFENILNSLISHFPGLYSFYRSMSWNTPRILFAIVIIVIGVKMIKGKKTELDTEEAQIQTTSINIHPQATIEQIIQKEKELNENA